MLSYYAVFVNTAARLDVRARLGYSERVMRWLAATQFVPPDLCLISRSTAATIDTHGASVPIGTRAHLPCLEIRDW